MADFWATKRYIEKLGRTYYKFLPRAQLYWPLSGDEFSSRDGIVELPSRREQGFLRKAHYLSARGNAGAGMS